MAKVFAADDPMEPIASRRIVVVGFAAIYFPMGARRI
jgi:hypothetical protein